MTSPYPTDLNKLQSIVWEQNDRNGWHESYDFRSPSGKGPNREAFGRELADIVMRTLDLAETLGIDLADHIHQNLKRNQHRGYKHGGKRL